MTAIAGADTELWRRCHGTARERGLAPALAALLSALPPGTSVLGPGGGAVLPSGTDTDGVVVREANLPGGPVVLVRGESGPGDPMLAVGALWLRLGLSQYLLDRCLEHLGERRTGGTTLLRQQLVQGAIAEVVTLHLQVRAELAVAGDSPGEGQLHAKLTEADRGLLRLLGAAGFLAGGPGEVADLSELLAGALTGESA
ncbi:DUF2786 domain-containing protein [Amycolatopsis magusensis]|uniref:DUF2786 domain-containing protein n=1 Tax=Amycolatopsis magusensis TaxID=882444 RepID=UPI0037A2B406